MCKPIKTLQKLLSESRQKYTSLENIVYGQTFFLSRGLSEKSSNTDKSIRVGIIITFSQFIINGTIQTGVVITWLILLSTLQCSLPKIKQDRQGVRSCDMLIVAKRK